MLNFVSKHKPDRVMFIYFWPNYRIYHGFEKPEKKIYRKKDDFFYENIGHFAEAVKNFTDQGV